jgi:hypothetical protein
MRGERSTNGEMWFVTHVVSYIAPIITCFVVLDPTTYAVKRHTLLSLTATD